MATYVVERDSYAGFGSAGKYFAGFGLAGGALGLIGWASMHSLLPGLRPVELSSQLLVVAMAWLGFGLAALMALVTLGSLMLSNKARGTVRVDDLGVTREIGARSWLLRWPEMEGFVVTPITAGITLIPREGRQKIVIPRFLDDYRGCVAEIKARGVKLLPPDNAQVMRVMRKKRTWKQVLVGYLGVLGFTMANNPREAHTARIVGLAGYVGIFALMFLFEDIELEDHGWVRWVSGGVLAGMFAWLVRHMMHTW